MSGNTTQDVSFDLTGQLLDLQANLIVAGLSARLIMTDDIKDYKKLREKAVEGKQPFYFGLAVPESIQSQVDMLVRQHKSAILNELLQLQLEDLQGSSLMITFDQDQDAYLVMLTKCDMGFFISARQTRPRRSQSKPVKTDARSSTGNKPVVSKAPTITLADVQAQVKKVEPKVARPSGNGTAHAANNRKKQPATKRRQFTVIRSVTS